MIEPRPVRAKAPLDFDIDADKAISDVKTAELRRDRLRAALPKLEKRYYEAQDSEELAEWRRRYETAKGARDQLSREFYERIPQLFGAIADLLNRVQQCDQDCDAVNADAPSAAHERLLSVELHSRNLPGYCSGKSIMKTLILPDWTDPNKLLWPPKLASIAASLAMSMVPCFGKRFSSKWHEAVAVCASPDPR